MSARTYVMVLVALLAAPALAVAQSEWYDDPVNPAIPPPDPGAWDGQRYPAAVLEVDGIYHLYYIGRLSSSGEAGLSDRSRHLARRPPTVDHRPRPRCCVGAIRASGTTSVWGAAA